MKIVKLKVEEFYPVMKHWWVNRNKKFPVVPVDMLPEEVFVCIKEDTPIYCVTIYHTNSKLCWIAWQISNPEVSEEFKEGGLTYLLDSVSNSMLSAGYKYVFTTSGTDQVIKSLLDSGFSEGDKNTNHYIKR